MRDHTPNAHLIKLGTMGEYGTPNIDIEEGFIEITHNGRTDVLPFPKMPGLAVPPVEGARQPQHPLRLPRLGSARDRPEPGRRLRRRDARGEARRARCSTRFDYDEAFGTALNRFCVQAVVGMPLTVYGGGSQTRGFLNIIDTLQCVELTAENPAGAGEYRVFNQFTETFTVAELAEKVKHAGGEVGIDVTVDNLPNPRFEAEEHYYNPIHTKLPSLGLQPTLLSETLIESTLGVIERYRDRGHPRGDRPEHAVAPAPQVGQPAS